MKIDGSKLKQDRGYMLGGLDAVDEYTRDIAKQYKKNISKSFLSISPMQLNEKVFGKEFYLTRKYDGEFNIVLFDGENSYLMNPGGKIRGSLPCLGEMTKVLKAAGKKSAILACEACMKEGHGERARVFNTLSAWADPKMQQTLCLVPFDIIKLDEQSPFYSNYDEQYQDLRELFVGSPLVFPPRYKKVQSKAEIKEIYDLWVEEEGSEGIVIRCDFPVVYKLKPRHSIDVVVVGYSEGIDEAIGQIRSLLLAVMPEDGKYQIIGKTGNGFSDEMRKEILKRLQPTTIPSHYIETDSNHVAFHMVRPEVILEVNFNDILTENSTSPVTNPIVEIVNGEYKLSTITQGFSMIFPIFERFRDDKSVNFTDLRLSQITDFTYIPPSEDAGFEHKASQILVREVYKKETKGKLMVKKFMWWKTNKEGSKHYPTHVFCYTDFSSERAEPLKREVRISNNEEQIMAIFDQYITENIKKGWEKVE